MQVLLVLYLLYFLALLVFCIVFYRACIVLYCILEPLYCIVYCIVFKIQYNTKYNTTIHVLLGALENLYNQLIKIYSVIKGYLQIIMVFKVYLQLFYLLSYLILKYLNNLTFYYDVCLYKHILKNIIIFILVTRGLGEL